MNDRHRLVKKLKQRQFMNDVKNQKIFMSTYIAVKNAMKKLDQRIMKEFSEE